MICLSFVMIQAIRIALSGAELYAPYPEEQTASEQGAVVVEGTVTDIQEKESVTAVRLTDCRIPSVFQQGMKRNILVYFKSDSKVYVGPDFQYFHLQENSYGGMDRGKASVPAIKIGNRISVEGTPSLFERARNPGNFDQQAYYARQGIGLLLWADHARILSFETDGLRQFLVQLRLTWKTMLIRQMGEYYGGTMSAILLGDKSGLDEEMKKRYQKNGIGHLLAISGLHMSFLGTGIYNLLRKTGLGFLPAGAAGGIILILYTLLAGAGVSSLRALIMFLVRIGAEVTGRDYDMPTSLALSAAVLCAWRPLYVTDAAFLLSFGAILGMMTVGPLMQETVSAVCGEKRIIENVAKGFAGSLSVNLMLLGPVLYFYFELPPYSVFLNLLVIPMLPLAMGAGLAGSGLMILGALPAGILFKICKLVLLVYDQVCSAVSLFPASRIVTGRPGPGWMVVYYAVLLSLCLLFYQLRGRQERKGDGSFLLRLPGILLFFFAVFMSAVCQTDSRKADGIEITVLDVGQGDCIHIRGENGNYLVDGGSSDISSPGIYRMEPYLLAEGIDTLDYVFVTHGDQDHINGIIQLLENQKMGVLIRTIVLPVREYWDEKLTDLAVKAREHGVRVAVMDGGQELHEKELEEKGRDENIQEDRGLVFICLGPEKGKELETGNAASLVLSVTYGNFNMILTGDVEGEGEKELVSSGRIRKCDVLKAAHHGSKHSSLESFLAEAQPAVTLISAGTNNKYGHPHAETCRRFASVGSRIYSTKERGGITVSTDGDMMEISGTLK